jgi:hypothetical protein
MKALLPRSRFVLSGRPPPVIHAPLHVQQEPLQGIHPGFAQSFYPSIAAKISWVLVS